MSFIVKICRKGNIDVHWNAIWKDKSILLNGRIIDTFLRNIYSSSYLHRDFYKALNLIEHNLSVNKTHKSFHAEVEIEDWNVSMIENSKWIDQVIEVSGANHVTTISCCDNARRQFSRNFTLLWHRFLSYTKHASDVSASTKAERAVGCKPRPTLKSRFHEVWIIMCIELSR